MMLLILGLSVMLFPFQEIEGLRTGYFVVQFKRRSLPAEYHFVKAKPKKWVKLESISPMAYQAIILSEDAHFFEHIGVDFHQLKNNLIQIFSKRKSYREKSTMTQQLGKKLFLDDEKDLISNIVEIPMAIYIDWRLPKKKVLESYLNAAEFGDQIYGITEASKFYFNKSPSALTSKEGAILATILAQPRDFSRFLKPGEFSSYTNRVILRTMKRMVQEGVMTSAQFESQMNQKYLWNKDDEQEIQVPEIVSEVSN